MSETPAPPAPNTIPPSINQADALLSGALQAPDGTKSLNIISKVAEGNDLQDAGQPGGARERPVERLCLIV